MSQKYLRVRPIENNIDLGLCVAIVGVDPGAPTGHLLVYLESRDTNELI